MMFCKRWPCRLLSSIVAGVLSSPFRVFVQEAEVGVRFYASSSTRGRGPPATASSVAAFASGGLCRVVHGQNKTGGVLHEVGKEPVAFFGSDVTFAVEEGRNYALKIDDDWLFLWCGVDQGHSPLRLSGPVLLATKGASLRVEGTLKLAFFFSNQGGADGGVLEVAEGERKKAIRLPRTKTPSAFVTVAADDVRVSGPGVIDSNGLQGHGLLVANCSGFRLEDLFFLNSGGWALVVRNASDVQISNVKVFSGADGIDVDSSRHVLISRPFVNSWDDAVVVKTTLGKGLNSEDVTVRDAQVLTRKSAYKLGTESLADFSGVTFADVDGYDLDRGAVIYLRDGGQARNISFTRASFFFKEWRDDDKLFGTALEFELQRRGTKTTPKNDDDDGLGDDHGLGDDDDDDDDPKEGEEESLLGLVVSDALIVDPTLQAAVLKGVGDAPPLADILLSNVRVRFDAALRLRHKKNEDEVPRRTNDTDDDATAFLFDCENPFVSGESVVAANVTVLPREWWKTAATPWPAGLAPGWPTHDDPPAVFELCPRGDTNRPSRRPSRTDDDHAVDVDTPLPLHHPGAAGAKKTTSPSATQSRGSEGGGIVSE